MSKSKSEIRRDAFKTLGIESTSNPDKIKQAYKNLVIKNHPDKVGDAYDDRMKEITSAYGFLTGKGEGCRLEADNYSDSNMTENMLVREDMLDAGKNSDETAEENNLVEGPTEIKALPPLEKKSKGFSIFDKKRGSIFDKKPIQKNKASEKEAFFEELRKISEQFEKQKNPQTSEEGLDKLVGYSIDKNQKEKASLNLFPRELQPLNYDSSQIDGLSEEFIKEKHHKLESRYKEVDEIIKEEAFLWCATKEGSAPIYLFGTLHKTCGVDIDDIFLTRRFAEANYVGEGKRR